MAKIAPVATTCPGCDDPLDASKFLCNLCASRTPDEQIVAIGKAVDARDTVKAAGLISSVASLIAEVPILSKG